VPISVLRRLTIVVIAGCVAAGVTACSADTPSAEDAHAVHALLARTPAPGEGWTVAGTGSAFSTPGDFGDQAADADGVREEARDDASYGENPDLPSALLTTWAATVPAAGAAADVCLEAATWLKTRERTLPGELESADGSKVDVAEVGHRCAIAVRHTTRKGESSTTGVGSVGYSRWRNFGTGAEVSVENSNGRSTVVVDLLARPEVQVGG